MTGIFAALKGGPRDGQIVRLQSPKLELLFPVYDPVDTRLLHGGEPVRPGGFQAVTYTLQRWRLARRETLYWIYSTSRRPLRRYQAVPLIRKIRMAAHAAGCAWWEKRRDA